LKKYKLPGSDQIAAELIKAGGETWNVRWDPCPHSMARPRIADGGKASSYGG
jgi:hypothetical protein